MIFKEFFGTYTLHITLPKFNSDLNHIKEDLTDIAFDIIEAGTDWTEASARINNLYMFRRFVLREGNSIVILEPDSLVTDIQDTLIESLDLYKK